MPLKRLVWTQEEKLHSPLQLVYGGNHVFVKVRMVDVFASADPRFTAEEKDYLFKAHFDFVVSDDNYVPTMAWELDGSYHDLDNKQIARDKKKDSICHKVGFPLVRIPLSEITSIEDWVSRVNRLSPTKRASPEMIADLIFAIRYTAENQDFEKLLTWLNNYEFRDIARWEFQFRGLADLLTERGYEGTIARLEQIARDVNSWNRLALQSGLSPEDWRHYGHPAWSAAIDMRERREHELGLTTEEYATTLECKLLQEVANAIAHKDPEGESSASILASQLEIYRAWSEMLSAYQRLAEVHPGILPYYIENIEHIADFIASESRDDITTMLSR